MKTIIIYATKYGATREIAKRIAAKIPGATVCDLGKDSVPSLSQFDCVILGGSLYAGMLLKEIKKFAALNCDKLSEKRLGLFLSGLSPDMDKIPVYFESNFPKDIVSNAAAKEFLGGIFDPAKAGWFDKLLFKAAAKQSAYVENILNDKIQEFVEKLRLHSLI